MKLTKDDLLGIASLFMCWGETQAASREWGAKLSVLSEEPGGCAMVTETFINWLTGNGVPKQDVKMITGHGCKDKSFKKLPEDSHTCAVIDGVVVDFTARQFKSSLPFPRIIPVSKFKSEWTSIE